MDKFRLLFLPIIVVLLVNIATIQGFIPTWLDGFVTVAVVGVSIYALTK